MPFKLKCYILFVLTVKKTIKLPELNINLINNYASLPNNEEQARLAGLMK